MKGPVVVLDAAGGIGRGVVQAALASGRAVIAVSLDQGELRQLRQRHPRADLTLVAGSIANEAQSAALATALRELDRPIAGFVISQCGELERGRVLDQPADSLHRRLEGDLLPQLAAARQLIPLLAEAGRNGGYVVIGSPGSEQPWAGYGYRSIAAAAVNMLVRVLHDEARSLGVRVQMLAISRPARTEDNDDCACDGWPKAVAIGEQALALIDQSGAQPAVNAVVPFESRGELAAADSGRARRTTDDDPIAASPTQAADSEADPESQPYLEQTWALLKPLLTSMRGEGR